MFKGTGSKIVLDIIKDIIDQQNITIDSLIIMNNKLVERLNKYLYTNKNNNKQYIIQSFDKTSHTKLELQNLMLASAIYLFEVRRFLLNEQITFLLGSHFIDENGNQTLREIRLSQKDVYQFLRIQDNQIVLREQIDALKALGVVTDITDTRMSNLWFEILKLSDMSSFYTEYDYYKLTNIYYKNNKPDYQVYLKFGTDKKGNIYSDKYYRKNDSFYFFNRGWLFEWFKEYIAKDELQIQSLEASIKQGSIEPIISKTDSIQTTKGGDYLEKNKQQEIIELQQIQAKYGNETIIKFNQIKDQLLALNDSFKLYKTLNQTKMPQSILDIFTDEKILQKMAELSNKNVDQIITDFKNHIRNLYV